jgi:hypothetical protein
MKLAAKPNCRASPLVISLNSQASSAAFSGIGLMHHVDLELTQRGLGNGGIGGNVHRLAGVIKR